MDWFEQRFIKIGDMLRPQLLQNRNDRIQILSEFANRNAPACFRPKPQPFLTTLIDFDRPEVVQSCNVQVDHSNLENAPIQVTYRTGFIPPGSFKRLMGFEKVSGVQQLNPLDSFRVKLSVTVGNFRCTKIGHSR